MREACDEVVRVGCQAFSRNRSVRWQKVHAEYLVDVDLFHLGPRPPARVAAFVHHAVLLAERVGQLESGPEGRKFMAFGARGALRRDPPPCAEGRDLDALPKTETAQRLRAMLWFNTSVQGQIWIVTCFFSI